MTIAKSGLDGYAAMETFIHSMDDSEPKFAAKEDL